MGTLTSYVGAVDAAKSAQNGSAGFSWINITGDYSSNGEFNVRLDGEQGEANAGGSAGRTRTRSAAKVAAAGGAVRPGGRGSRTRGGGATSGISGGRGAGRRGRRLCANAGAPSQDCM